MILQFTYDFYSEKILIPKTGNGCIRYDVIRNFEQMWGLRIFKQLAGLIKL